MKTEQVSAPANRREFLRGSVRGTLLGALAAVSVVLFRRSGGRLTGQTCINRGICSGCTAFAGCGLPQALSAKEFQARVGRREPAGSHPGKELCRLPPAATHRRKEAAHET